jgi:glycosyltransferase involved in cell wall biosynthesis/GT2 family glycosyltransferase
MVPCRPAVPLVGPVAAPELYRGAAAHARDAGLRIVVVGELDPRCIELLRTEAPETSIEVAVPPDVAEYFAKAASIPVLPCDSGHETDLAGLAAELLADGPAVLVLPLVLERLADPRPLLRTLRQALLAHPDSRLFLAAADRASLRGADYAGPPPDPTRVREWSRPELRDFLQLGGFTIERQEVLDEGLTLFVLACDPVAYAGHLAAHGLPPPGARYLLVSAEHAACRTTGGIGAYSAQMERRFQADGLAFLYVGAVDDLTVARRRVRWLIASELLGAERLAALKPAEVVHEVLPTVLFLYPNLRFVEGPDYRGLCAIAMQARRAGLLPPHLRFITRCHGSQTYIEHCFHSWRPASDLAVTYLERAAVEQADVVSFLTRFLERLYDAQGYRIPYERRELVPYPFDFTDARLAPDYEPIDTLVFFGKRTRMKGFPLFVEALRALVDGGALGSVRRIVVIGRKDGVPSEAEAALAGLRSRLVIEEREGPNRQVLAWLREEAPRALVLLPYRGDNFPVSIPEAIACGCQILAARAGGIPEMIPNELADELLHDDDVPSLVAAIRRALLLDGSQRRALASLSLEAMRARLDAPPLPPVKPHIEVQTRSTVGVIVPCYATRLNYLEDLLAGMHQQSRPADRVVFVDDGSPGDYAAELESFLAARARVPWRLVRHVANRGLSAARNSGLRELDTDYVVNLDSDDVPRPDFLRRYVDYLDRDREVVAVTSWLARFFDGEDFQRSDACVLIYRPLGSGLALAITENCLGHANSAFRRHSLLELGGWDETDRSMWEDYALFIRILSTGAQIGVVPQSEVLYRVHPQSMARTYEQFPAQQRLGRSLEALPRFDALRLEGLVRTLRADVAQLEARVEELAARPMKESKLSMKRLIRWGR